jgi:hypothetical protein
MATAEKTLRSAEARTWDLFHEALDPDSPAAARLPSGAAFVARDAPDREELVRRYRAEGRAVVLVSEDGSEEIIRGRGIDPKLLVVGLAVVAAVIWLARRPTPAPP